MPDPRAVYSQRLAAYQELVSAKNRLHIRIGNFKLAVVAAGLFLAGFCLHRNSLSSYWLLLPVALYAGLAVAHEQILRQRSRAETATSFYRQGIARIEDRWAGTGQPGDRFRDEKHVYADDLDLFGRGSWFELLSTARLPMGENWLAHWLCTPSPKPAILERQGLVAELREKLDLHRDLSITGEELRIRLNPESLIGWAEGKSLMPGVAVRAMAVLLALAFVAAGVFYVKTDSALPILAVLVVEIFFRRWLHRNAEAVIEGISCNAEGLSLFADILQRFEREPFTAPRLQGFAAELNRDAVPASRSIRKLARIVYWIDSHHSLLAHIVELPLLYSVQVAFSAEAWRRRCGARMRMWVAMAGEMEALISLATYSFEHPQDPFPTFLDPSASPLGAEFSSSGAPSPGAPLFYPEPRRVGFKGADFSSPLFDGQELGHPLIPAAKCVPNSVRLDSTTRVLLVSGSNMSGKSTLLRAVGINAVLANAGAPIRGKSLRLTPLQIGTRIRSTDSLLEGRSNFYTEILHIRRVFDALATKNNPGEDRPPLLFLFDELLEGTNSKDRRIGAESLLRALLQHRAIGIVTTHDLALTEITAALGNPIRNMHFEDQVENGQMRFDYKLRGGVVTKSNALALMRLIGLDV
jgi:MutS domain V